MLDPFILQILNELLGVAGKFLWQVDVDLHHEIATTISLWYTLSFDAEQLTVRDALRNFDVNNAVECIDLVYVAEECVG